MELFKRILKEVWLPTLVAIGWGIVIFHNQTEKNLVVALGAAASAFFLVFFFQGQVLRIKKNIRDERNDERTYQGVTSLADAVNEIRVMLQVNAPAGPEAPEPVNHFFALADEGLRSGVYYSAAITAAQGFEFEARRVAEAVLKEDPMRRPLGIILNMLHSRIPETSWKQLRLLHRTRNTLVHETTPDSITPEQASELVSGFREGAEVLRNIIAY